MFEIVEGGLDDPRVIALLVLHTARATAETARGSAHALDVEGLKTPDIRFWSMWGDGALLAVGALRELEPGHGEVKSMHTAEAARRKGAGRAMLAHIVSQARAAGLSRLSLETGSWPYFEPARALYRANGFRECSPYAHYRLDPNSTFMTLELGP